MSKIYVDVTKVVDDRFLRKHKLWSHSYDPIPMHISVNIILGLGIPIGSRYKSTPIVEGRESERHIDDNTFTIHDFISFGKKLYYTGFPEKRYVTHVLYRSNPYSNDSVEYSIDDFIQEICSKEIDRHRLSERIDHFRYELIEKALHPSRLEWIF